jgi:hypothetical protein
VLTPTKELQKGKMCLPKWWCTHDKHKVRLCKVQNEWCPKF